MAIAHQLFLILWLVNFFFQYFKRAVVTNGDEANEGKSTNYKESLYRPPTSEEINALKETENLFKSSLFRMQVCSK